MEKTALFVDLVKKKKKKKEQAPEVTGQEYLLGFRGLLVIESFIWTFLIVFAPNAVKDAAISSDGPTWQMMLRKTASVLFWNKTMIYTFFVILSARTLAIPFFKNPTKTVIAGAVFRRGIRLAIPVAVSLAIITIAFNNLGVSYIDDFKTHTHNIAMTRPTVINNALIYFNSVYQLFWVTQKFYRQSGNFAFPSSTLWTVNLIYQQSYTVFIIMVIAPYTRAAWRVKMAVPFIITAWWVQSWSWYSVTGLLMADAVMNMDFKAKAQRGIPIPLFKRTFRLPTWIPALIVLASGLTMQYLWAAWRPDMLENETDYHTGLYWGGELNRDTDILQPEARDDNWLVAVGFFIILETFDFVQTILNNPVFVYLGKRSLSWFLTQSWIIYIIGIKLYTHLVQGSGASTDAINAACFLTTLAATLVTGEIFYRLVDCPSDVLAKKIFDWMRK